MKAVNVLFCLMLQIHKTKTDSIDFTIFVHLFIEKLTEKANFW